MELRTLRSWIVLAAGVFALAAADCNSSDMPALNSGIEGLVTLGPNCPVVRVGQPCPDTPYEAEIAITTPTGNEVALTTSGADGRYRVLLKPGDYVVVPQNPPGSQIPSASPVVITVRLNSFATADIAYDTGIR